jgi:hypothetical protein
MPFVFSYDDPALAARLGAGAGAWEQQRQIAAMDMERQKFAESIQRAAASDAFRQRELEMRAQDMEADEDFRRDNMAQQLIMQGKQLEAMKERNELLEEGRNDRWQQKLDFDNQVQEHREFKDMTEFFLKGQRNEQQEKQFEQMMQHRREQLGQRQDEAAEGAARDMVRARQRAEEYNYRRDQQDRERAEKLDKDRFDLDHQALKHDIDSNNKEYLRLDKELKESESKGEAYETNKKARDEAYALMREAEKKLAKLYAERSSRVYGESARQGRPPQRDDEPAYEAPDPVRQQSAAPAAKTSRLPADKVEQRGEEQMKRITLETYSDLGIDPAELPRLSPEERNALKRELNLRLMAQGYDQDGRE